MKKAIILGFLLCSSLLVGCSNNKKTTEASKENKIEKSASKNSVTEKTSSKSEVTKSTEQTVSESASQNPSQSAAEPVVTEQDINPGAIFNGDISSIVGKWEDTKGDYIIINSDYTVTHSSTQSSPHPFKPYEADYNQFIANPGLVVSAEIGGYAIKLFPTGYHNTIGDQSNIDRPRLTWGNSPSEDYYYRK